MTKRRDSRSWNTALKDLLSQHRANSLVMAGLASDTCISATVADVFAVNFPAAVATNTTASPDSEFEGETWEFMREQPGQQLIDTRENASHWA